MTIKRLKLFHDILKISEDLIIINDNSGSIGEKEWDEVNISYDRVAYYLFRVAYMESIAAGALPKSLILHNFNGDIAWPKLKEGLEKAFTELEISPLKIEGSTESNFELKESATSLLLISEIQEIDYFDWTKELKSRYDLAVIGEPLVGEEVLTKEQQLPSLKNFRWISEQEEVIAMIPVGSKGIQSELKRINPNMEITFPKELDLKKSAGPASSYIILYKKEFNLTLQNELKELVFKGIWRN